MPLPLAKSISYSTLRLNVACKCDGLIRRYGVTWIKVRRIWELEEKKGPGVWPQDGALYLGHLPCVTAREYSMDTASAPTRGGAINYGEFKLNQFHF